MPRNSRWSNIDRLLGLRTNGQLSRRQWIHEEERALLPQYRNEQIDSAISPPEVTKVCLRLRHLIQECVPCEMEETRITTPHSRIITPQVVQAAKEAGGQEHRGCVVYCLLVNQRWFKHEALVELWDSGLHHLRAEACGVVAKALIEGEEDIAYLLHSVLLRRYSYVANGVPTAPVNVIEKAVDLHAVRVIGSSGYQKCISYLWRGWLVQDENDPSVFVDYLNKDNPNFFAHMDPDRMRSPRNQNAAQLLFSLIYLGLYTIAINSVNPSGVLDGAEVALYAFTLGYVCDEIMKFYKAGYHILGFWNALNGILYTFLTVSLIFRVIGLTFANHTDGRSHYSTLSYNMLAFVAPLFWCRLLLYLDSFRFFGAMLVVLKVMMKESVIFFALLIIVIIGFLQAFIGLDLAEDNVADDVAFIVESMTKAILQSPEFDGFEGFGPPWGAILYYLFTFVVMIILLNILIALYNSAYVDIYENADDEYLALFSQKTMQFVRAPDENVYIAPLNLVEIVISALFEWWMNKKAYKFINDCVMTVLYSPLLVITAYFETRTAHAIRRNRARGEEDDDVIEEWEQLAHGVDFEAEGWAKTCQAVKPNMDDDPAVLEIRKMRAEIDGLKTVLAEISEAVNFTTSQDTRIAEDLLTEPVKAAEEVAHKFAGPVQEATSESSKAAEEVARESVTRPVEETTSEASKTVEQAATEPSKEPENVAAEAVTAAEEVRTESPVADDPTHDPQAEVHTTDVPATEDPQAEEARPEDGKDNQQTKPRRKRRKNKGKQAAQAAQGSQGSQGSQGPQAGPSSSG